MKQVIKKIIKVALITLSAVLFLVGGGVILWAYKKKTNHFWGGPLMSMDKVCATWGSAPLDTTKFKEAFTKIHLQAIKNKNSKVTKLSSDIPSSFYQQEKSQQNSYPSALLRAKMACSLLKNQRKFYGKDVTEIRDMFGPRTGHYFIDRSPAYIIGPAKAKGKNTWQVVFLINRKDKVKKIIVHKNCCS